MKITINLFFTMLISAFLMLNCGTKRCVKGDKADAVNGATCVDSRCQEASYSGGFRDASPNIMNAFGKSAIPTACVFDADNCKTSADPTDIADPAKKIVLEDGSCAEW